MKAWIFLAVLSLTLPAQVSSEGEIRLQVNDPSGAGMRAAGRLENPSAGIVRDFHTDSYGKVTLAKLPFGSYRARIFEPGFATETLAIQIDAAGILSRVVTMKIGAQTARTDVVSETPLAGTDLDTDQIAAPVQTGDAQAMKNSGALDLSDFLNRRMNGVYLNEMQGNPFQPDVNFRGYTASPLLGTPQGISVYVDGVRQNQPFGDVVSWDLIPKDAISEVTLIPGSDPLFGLNTLGGAISVQTKSGLTNPGLAGHALYGSSGRKEVEGEWGGGKATGFNWFASGLGFHESGWRYASPSDVRQGFVRLGWRTPKTDLALTASYAYNTLFGNGLQEYQLLEQNYSSSYSVPDVTANRAPSFNFMARHSFSDRLNVAGNAWYRNIRSESINPNFNSNVLGNDIYQPTLAEQQVLTAAGYTSFPASGADVTNTPFPKWPCIAEALSLGSPDSTCDGVTIYSKQAQNDYGFSGQLSWLTDSRLGRNQFAAGALMDRNDVRFSQSSVYGYVNPDYTLTNVPAWQDGSTVDANGNAVDNRVGLKGHAPNWSFYFADTLTFWKKFNLTVSGRYNRDSIHNIDQLNPVAGPGSLTGNYTFERFNPSVGLTWSPVSKLNAYARFSQGSRAPTSIELGCADPTSPCSLPNALQSDPPLQQVITDTWEMGLRGKVGMGAGSENVNWNLGAYRNENHNDILFVAAPLLGTGYFQNFARTLREGFDADVDGRLGRVAWGLNWTFLSATYQSVETLGGSGNNTNDIALQGYPGLAGVITVHPGNRIPLIPKQSGKAYAVWQATRKLLIEADEVAVSSSYARGNENNAYSPDGVYYLGPGVSAGYAVTNLRAHYDFTRHWQLAVQVDNLFDRRYDTAAQLATTVIGAQGAFQSMPFQAYADGPYAGSVPAQSATFFGPGAPRRAWVELGVRF